MRKFSPEVTRFKNGIFLLFLTKNPVETYQGLQMLQYCSSQMEGRGVPNTPKLLLLPLTSKLRVKKWNHFSFSPAWLACIINGLKKPLKMTKTVYLENCCLWIAHKEQ